jgi:hypothetical protein
MSEPISLTFTGSTGFVFTSPLIAAFSFAEKAVAVLAGLPVPRVPVLREMPDAYAPAQGQSVLPDWTAVPNSWAP